MIGNQGWGRLWQGRPEKLEEDRRLSWVIIVVVFFMLPGRGQMSMTPQMIEAAVLDLPTVKIRHVSLLLPQEAMECEVG